MTSDHLNFLWAELIIEELARNGVMLICIAPGSRSSPLTLAAARNPKIKTIVHFDERGATFCAVGYARATGIAAAVICTSGTAVANCSPAVVEASQSGTPLIILSADRPPELLDTGALQTIDQNGIFGKYTRWAATLPTPTESISPAFLLTTVDKACARANSSPMGPTHLNCPFREPLAPTDENNDWSNYLSPVERWLTSDSAYTNYDIGGLPADDTLETVAVELAASKRGIIIAGPLPSWQEHRSIRALADKLDWPLLADISSGLRTCGDFSENLICHSDLYLRIPEIRERPKADCILQFGGVPISKHVQRYMAECGARWIVVQSHPVRQDPAHAVSHRIVADPETFAEAMFAHVDEGKSELKDVFLSADQLTAKVVNDYVASSADQPLELAVAPEIFRQSGQERGIYLATSMPIRDADSFVSQCQTRIHVAANRGVNGIDGTVASAVGLSEGLQLPVTLLTGDLALLHDLNSLSLVSRAKQPITIVVINNNGGGIFSFLRVADVKDHFEPYFGTPHEMTFEYASHQFGIGYSRVRCLSEFAKAMNESYLIGQSGIIEVTTDRSRNFEQHQQVWQLVADEVRRALAPN